MEQRISLVTLGVENLARARAFYEKLGWGGAHQPDDEVAFFQAGAMVFGLWTALGGHGAPGIELAHNVRSPDEVDALLAEAERAGATIARPAARADWGGYSGAFADPDGQVWEVAHNPGWTLADDGSVRLAPPTQLELALEWLKGDYGLRRGHAMALVHVITKRDSIDAKHVGTTGTHRDDSDTLWLDGRATRP